MLGSMGVSSVFRTTNIYIFFFIYKSLKQNDSFQQEMLTQNFYCISKHTLKTGYVTRLHVVAQKWIFLNVA